MTELIKEVLPDAVTTCYNIYIQVKGK